MSTIPIAVDAARDAAKRASDDADESYFRRRDRVTTEIAREVECASSRELAEILWSTLDAAPDGSRLHLLDDVLAAVRNMAAARTAFSAHAAACSLVLAWDKAKNEVIQRTVNARMREQS